MAVSCQDEGNRSPRDNFNLQLTSQSGLFLTSHTRNRLLQYRCCAASTLITTLRLRHMLRLPLELELGALPAWMLVRWHVVLAAGARAGTPSLVPVGGA